MLTLAMDENGDIYVDKNGNFATVSELEALRQKILQRLRLFLGEWFLDTTRGVPYFQNILGENVNPSIATQILTNEIAKEDEITAVKNVQYTFDRITRNFTYSATVSSVWGSTQVELP